MKEGLKFEAVQPVRPIAPYVGGKRALAKRLVEKPFPLHQALVHLTASPCKQKRATSPK